MNIGILGSGSWAVALAKVLCEKQSKEEKIHWYFRKKEDIDFFKYYGHSPRYLPTVKFDTRSIVFHQQPELLFKETDYILLAIPSAFLDEALQRVSRNYFKNKIFFSAVKGIIPSHLLIIGEYLNRVFEIPYERIGVLTGPCHAEEVAMEKLSFLTVASENPKIRNEMATRLNCRYLQTIESDDIFGTELAAVLKNVYAIAGGICMGMGYGDNFLAVLATFAMKEMKELIHQLHPIDRDMYASAYMGDFLVTLYSQYSRNRMFGMMLGKGHSVRQAKMEMNMVAEGYYAAACIEKICRDKGIQPALVNFTYSVLYKDASPFEEIKKILPLLN